MMTYASFDTKHLEQLIATISLKTVLMILEYYQQDVDRKMYIMAASANVGEYEAVQSAARSVKGASANLGITKIIELARHLEQQTINDTEELKKAVESLKNEFILVKKELHLWSRDKKAGNRS